MYHEGTFAPVLSRAVERVLILVSLDGDGREIRLIQRSARRS